MHSRALSKTKPNSIAFEKLGITCQSLILAQFPKYGHTITSQNRMIHHGSTRFALLVFSRSAPHPSPRAFWVLDLRTHHPLF